ncbi:hypothetical protein L2E82_48855 [Cichorium intybus]|uniref:Uncharacterized protein n=1 Tax=Cichorium intybus TaxID=13427 RepID=A0ACB8YZ05_CICIN|nr:hypothetical protein L2E82_48855 [Cichorium intybus]
MVNNSFSVVGSDPGAGIGAKGYGIYPTSSGRSQGVPVSQTAPATRLNQTQMEQVRELIAEEFNNAFNDLIPNVTTDIITQVRALLDERFAAVHGGALPAPLVRDSAYYYEKFSKCHPP